MTSSLKEDPETEERLDTEIRGTEKETFDMN